MPSPSLHIRITHFFVGCLLMGIVLLTGRAEALILDQAMRGGTAPGWVIGGAAYLTASTGVDTAGDGWLRLTEAAGNQAGYAFYDNSFSISSGVVIQFDYSTWGGNGADGYSIYLFDGSYDSATFSAGASGGSLGYAQKVGTGILTDDVGLTGGYLGVGVDEWGNFSSATEGRILGPGQRANSVSVRGPYDHPSGAYAYIGGTAAGVGTLWFNQGYRPGQSGADYRKVIIYLTPVAAPQYMQIDVFMQFGYNQPLTYLINTLYTMRPIPTMVKVGYAASTGGSTNVHEIRNLTIDNLPTDINLALAKTASPAVVAPGGALTYTVTARNYGPNLVTIANNVPIIDTLPAHFIPGAWSCVGSGGGICAAAPPLGSGNLNTTATLPFNSAVTYTNVGIVRNNLLLTPLGTVFSNTSTLTPPAGITDYNPADNSASASTTVSNGNISIAGTVYNDNGVGGGIAHNGVRDGTEAGVVLASPPAYYAKLFRVGDLTTTVPGVANATVNPGTGLYTLTNVPGYGDYIVILSSNNTTAYDPSFPSPDWSYVTPLNYTKTGVVASGANLNNQNFFVYNGSRIAGKVIKDDGFNGSLSTAYDGILNAAETGIAGVTVTLRNDANTLTYDTTTTDVNGTFVLFTNTASANLRIYETNLAAYTSVSYNPGTTAGTYTIAGEYIRFAYTLYNDYNNILFGDIPPPVTISLTPTPLSASGSSVAPVYYAHTFTSTARGSVVFTADSRTQGGWPAIIYLRDTTCNGFDAGDTVISGAITVEVGENICIVARETIPAGAVNNDNDILVTRSTFTYGLASQGASVTDTTTVRFPILSTSTKDWVDLNGGDPLPGHVIRYTITLLETAGVAANNVSVSDTISASFSNFSVISFPSGANDLSTPGSGPLNITGIAIPANGSATIVFDVTIPLGTATGTVINNSATVTVPGGIGGTLPASPLTVNGGSVAGTGNKPLYLYGGAASPYKMSRTVTPGAPTTAAIPGGAGASAIWNGNQPVPLALNDTITAASATIYLNANSNNARTVELRLYCSSNAAAYASWPSAALATNPPVPPALPTAYNFNLTTLNGGFAFPATCAAPNYWVLRLYNNTGNAARSITVVPVSGGNYSRVVLASSNIININNSNIDFYNNSYASGGSVVTSAAAGSTVYVRATVSDPFGAFDISGATVALTDSLGAVKLTPSPQAMTEIVALATASTKTFEYGPYNILPAGPDGAWTARIVATEGTELPAITDYALQGLTVTPAMPSLLIVKSVQTYSDPINGTTNPKAIPGAFMTYIVQVTNTGPGAVDIGTTKMTDPIPANTELFVGDIGPPGSGPVLFSNGATASGLSFSFLGLNNLTDNLSFSDDGGSTYTKSNTSADANGCDPTITHLKVSLGGIFNGAAGPNQPAFNLIFRVRVK